MPWDLPPPIPAPLPATTYHYYVAPHGRDGNPGTTTAPFRSIARAAREARPGTTVHVAPGTYAGGFKTSASGAPGARIYFVSSTTWAARIVPPARSSTASAWDNRGSYVDIVGFRIDGAKEQAGIRWRHGIYNGGSYDAIRHNWIHDIATHIACTGAGGAAIGVDSYYGGVKSDVTSNLVHDIGPTGCRFVHGIYMSTSGSVKNNVVYRVAEAAIHLWHDANDVIITNNTVTSSHTGIIVGGGDFYYRNGGNNHTVVANNIVYDNAMGISEQGKTGTENRYANNLVYRNPGYSYRLRHGLVPVKALSAAPGFVNYSRSGTPDLRLSKGSAAIGKGTWTHAPLVDFHGKPRRPGARVDLGAFQHQD